MILLLLSLARPKIRGGQQSLAIVISFLTLWKWPTLTLQYSLRNSPRHSANAEVNAETNYPSADAEAKTMLCLQFCRRQIRMNFAGCNIPQSGDREKIYDKKFIKIKKVYEKKLHYINI